MVDALTKSMLGTTVGLQSTALALNNLGLVISKKKGKKKNFGLGAPSTKKLVNTGVGNIIGIGFIGAESSMINAL